MEIGLAGLHEIFDEAVLRASALGGAIPVVVISLAATIALVLAWEKGSTLVKTVAPLVVFAAAALLDGTFRPPLRGSGPALCCLAISARHRVRLFASSSRCPFSPLPSRLRFERLAASKSFTKPSAPRVRFGRREASVPTPQALCFADWPVRSELASRSIPSLRRRRRKPVTSVSRGWSLLSSWSLDSFPACLA